MNSTITIKKAAILAGPVSTHRCVSKAKKHLIELGLYSNLFGEVPDHIRQFSDKILTAVRLASREQNYESLAYVASLLAELFLIRGIATYTDEHNETQAAHWSVTNGCVINWIHSACGGKIDDYRLVLDDNPERIFCINSHPDTLGWYLLPSFIDLNDFVHCFVSMPDEIDFHRVERKKTPEHIATDYSHIVAFEDSSFLFGIKEKLLSGINTLPDPYDNYASMFNRVLKHAIYPSIHDGSSDQCPRIVQAVVREYSQSLLALPIADIEESNRLKVWTPWSYGYCDFSRVTRKYAGDVYMPAAGQLKWLSEDHQHKVSLTLINRVIPSQYQWHMGILNGWKNRYRNNEQRLAMVQQWGRNAA